MDKKKCIILDINAVNNMWKIVKSILSGKEKPEKNKSKKIRTRHLV